MFLVCILSLQPALITNSLLVFRSYNKRMWDHETLLNDLTFFLRFFVEKYLRFEHNTIIYVFEVYFLTDFFFLVVGVIHFLII
jgi:hypothetical protein